MCLSSSTNNTIFKNQERKSTCNGNHYITQDKAENYLNLNAKLREADWYNVHSLDNLGTEMDESQTQKEKALQQKYQWKLFLGKYLTKCTHTVITRKRSTAITHFPMYQELFNTCMTGTYFFI